MNKAKIYNELITKFGKQQIIVAIEELSELQKELCKYSRGNQNESQIIEEIADVEIMLEQIKMYFGISDVEIEAVKVEKLARTKKRLL